MNLTKLAAEQPKTLEELRTLYDEAYTPQGYEEVEWKDKDDYGATKSLGGIGSLMGGLMGANAGLNTDPIKWKSAGKAGAIGAGIGGGLGLLAGRYLDRATLQSGSYDKPIFTPEQEEKQMDFYDNNMDDQIIDRFGEQATSTGKYNGPQFSDVFDYSYSFDNNNAALVQKYPRLLEAMKQDSRRDRGGILYHFGEEMHNYGTEPEMQQKVYDVLNKQLDNDEFGGWKYEWTPEQLDAYLNKKALAEATERFEKTASFIEDPQAFVDTTMHVGNAVYPNNLFKTVAHNVLARQRKEKPTSTIQVDDME